MSKPCQPPTPVPCVAAAVADPPSEALLLAQQLHDELAQLLAQALVQLDLARSDAPAQAGAARTQARQLVLLALRAVRRTIGQLQPGPGAELSQALTACVRALSLQYGTAIDYTPPEPVVSTAPPGVVAALLSSAQELLCNACKHGGGAVPRLRLTVCRDRLELYVEDRGPGFDLLATLPLSDGQGLHLLRARLAAVGLRLELCAAPGQGVQARVVWSAAAVQP